MGDGELRQASYVQYVARTQDCWTALISAAKEGHVEVVMELLDNNANVEHRDMVKKIVLHVFLSNMLCAHL